MLVDGGVDTDRQEVVAVPDGLDETNSPYSASDATAAKASWGVRTRGRAGWW
jgi:hypothetical protein